MQCKGIESTGSHTAPICHATRQCLQGLAHQLPGCFAQASPSAAAAEHPASAWQGPRRANSEAFKDTLNSDLGSFNLNLLLKSRLGKPTDIADSVISVLRSLGSNSPQIRYLHRNVNLGIQSSQHLFHGLRYLLCCSGHLIGCGDVRLITLLKGPKTNGRKHSRLSRTLKHRNSKTHKRFQGEDSRKWEGAPNSPRRTQQQGPEHDRAHYDYTSGPRCSSSAPWPPSAGPPLPSHANHARLMAPRKGRL